MLSNDMLYENRIINGVLKSQAQLPNAAAAQLLLTKEVEVIADSSRLEGDLWPCVWALAAVLARQFFGMVYINCGLTEALPAPAPLPRTCVFGASASPDAIRVSVGTSSGKTSITIDARGNTISLGKLLAGSREPAHPISCFAIAGYAGFAALARAAGIPSFRDTFSRTELVLPQSLTDGPINGLTLVGLGQLGQAYLAMLYFLRPLIGQPTLFLVDRDRFESCNQGTQVLLSGDDWMGRWKTEYLQCWAKRIGFECESQTVAINWDWIVPEVAPRIALLGLDDLDVRRMCTGAGFEWLIEAGVGTSFARPRVTWHSFPPIPRVANELFAPLGTSEEQPPEDARYADELKATPGECGWVTFKGIKATAPSMGLVAAAYALTELLLIIRRPRILTTGMTYTWSPLLPYLRDKCKEVIATERRLAS